MKYRIWDDLFQRFSTEVRLEPGQDSNDFMYHMFELYTGLKDKNGKEVCEGDIVEYEGDFGTDQYPDMRTFTVSVGFDGGAFYPVSEIPMRIVAVIGNIHENQELIEGES